jgi:hypothetical protein
MATNTAPKPAAKAEKTGLTDYVILKVHTLDGTGGKTVFEEFARVPARQGQPAIKLATLREDGAHEPGTYRAVTASTWDAPSNRLSIKTETKPVSVFE